eukprot:TRINITY_DN32786_c0_g1_i1.p3 TRINITY_DN32786_c0_g1~~TRINITY_DN32786_c0_g1_i1.p3  ORF type:complete len:183 (+),score=33.52 TRINITY_DN32786_c0_g1_i1:78-551(+)
MAVRPTGRCSGGAPEPPRALYRALRRCGETRRLLRRYVAVETADRCRAVAVRALRAHRAAAGYGQRLAAAREAGGRSMWAALLSLPRRTLLGCAVRWWQLRVGILRWAALARIYCYWLLLGVGALAAARLVALAWTMLVVGVGDADCPPPPERPPAS